MENQKKQSYVINGILTVLAINQILIGYLFYKNTCSSSNRHEYPPMEDRLHHGPADIFIKKLNLTPTQTPKFKEMARNHHENSVKITESIKDRKRKIADILKEDHPDTSEAKRIIAEISEKQVELEMLTFNHLLDVRKLCTKDQIPKFNDFIGRMAEMLDNRRENRPPPPPPREEE
jgi:Spy/CpxP family protein refolding chaperone